MTRHALTIGLSVISLATPTALGGCSRRDENQAPAAATEAGQTPTART
ncbi:hypothetical protein [Caulobacter segnis]|nr:hypothetical protein [Caulobacter segnis]